MRRSKMLTLDSGKNRREHPCLSCEIHKAKEDKLSNGRCCSCKDAKMWAKGIDPTIRLDSEFKVENNKPNWHGIRRTAEYRKTAKKLGFESINAAVKHYVFVEKLPYLEITKIMKINIHTLKRRAVLIKKGVKKRKRGGIGLGVRRDSETGVTGVSFYRGKYWARVNKDGKGYHLGVFADLISAIKARWEKEKELNVENCYTTSSAYKYLKERGLAE
jgi:hypothetical protein